MYHELFKIEDGEVRPLTSREATIKEVRLILQRDRGSNGDSDGRKKLFAYKELGAVYWIADYRSPGRMQGYEGTELIEDAIRNFELPAEWKPDKVISDLITKYEAHVDGGVAGQTLVEIAATFNLMLKTIKTIRQKLTTKLQAVNITEDELKNLINLSNELLKLAADIPKKTKEIELAREMLKQYESDAEVGRGNQKILSSMK
jgi:hypothetical protein